MSDTECPQTIKHHCERCYTNRVYGAVAVESVGQYFIEFKRLMWLCKRCTSVMVTMYGHDLRERQRFEKQFRAATRQSNIVKHATGFVYGIVVAAGALAILFAFNIIAFVPK